MAKKRIPKLVKEDVWLMPYLEDITDRIFSFNGRLDTIKKKYGSLKKFASAYLYLGLNYDKRRKGWHYREWAPDATSVSFIGDFNNWDRTAHQLTKDTTGVWEIFIPDTTMFLPHLSKYKVHVISDLGKIDRLPAYVKYVVQDKKTTDFSGCLWNPPCGFKWSDAGFSSEEAFEQPYIYECHVGMGLEKEGVATYVEFADEVLPRIVEQGYNIVQLMAVHEHPYYASFGYHVSNFFAPSSRFGTPDDLKYLINKSHEMGLSVIMDIVHSHAVKNIAEGLSQFGGLMEQYFHQGDRGIHDQWDSKLFNYGKEEVLQFLLSNVRYWLKEFHFDGFRFDGVTSMLYYHHGNVEFDNYGKYFQGFDKDAVLYLQLANKLIKDINRHSISIAEDMSGMPGLCRKFHEGGIGFDLRLGMGLPDFWIKTLKHKRDEEWNVFEIWDTMTNRRRGERTIGYVESHDQALVGDKSLSFWLMDREMYSNMHVDHDSLVVDRGIALHKIIRLLTLSTGGEGWLNFIGNEFGHPEWVDFPREGNDWSYKYAKRQWSLADSKDLRYQYLNNYGKAMVTTMKHYNVLSSKKMQQLNMDQDNRTMVFQRANLIFALNMSDHSIPDYRFKVPWKGKYKIILNSDDGYYGGFGRVDTQYEYPAIKLIDDYFMSVYLPGRVGLVMSCQDI